MAYIEEMRHAKNVWLENLKGREHSEDLSIDRRVKLKLILELVWTEFIWPRTEISGKFLKMW
jgi:hypothetical protein